jgi:hypothetical protein
MIISLLIVAAVAFLAGYVLKHCIVAGKLASIQTLLRYEAASAATEIHALIARVHTLIADVRAKF